MRKLLNMQQNFVKMVDKNIDGLESDRDFIKMTTDMKKNDESINIPGYIMPEHKMAPNHPVQA